MQDTGRQPRVLLLSVVRCLRFILSPTIIWGALWITRFSHSLTMPFTTLPNWVNPNGVLWRWLSKPIKATKSSTSMARLLLATGVIWNVLRRWPMKRARIFTIWFSTISTRLYAYWKSVSRPARSSPRSRIWLSRRSLMEIGACGWSLPTVLKCVWPWTWWKSIRVRLSPNLNKLSPTKSVSSPTPMRRI